MNNHELNLFLLCFILPCIYQRMNFMIRPHSFRITRLRDRTGIAIHHGHWGLLWIFLSSMLMIFGMRNVWVILLAGFGWGLLFDEIIPHLKMPSDQGRDKELQVYARHGPATITLIIVTTLIIWILGQRS